MSLAQTFAATTPREISGSRTPGRFDYQTHWGIGLILRCHSESSDYAVAFDFHDDVVWLNHSSDPDRLRFYQVKTKQTGSWSISDLTRSPSTKNPGVPSIIGRMIENCRLFEGHVDGATLVSNASCLGVPYEKTDCRFCDCGVELVDALRDKLKANAITASDGELDLLWFHRTDLSLGDAENHAKGVFNKFLTTSYGDQAIGLDALYQAIFDECRRRTLSTATIATFAQLVEHKAVTRLEFQGWLSAVTTAHLAPKWEGIQSDLKWAALEKRAVRREWNVFHPQALDPGNEAVRAVRRALRAALESYEGDGELTAVIEALSVQVRPKIEEILAGSVTEARLRAMLLWEYADQ